MIKVWKLSKPLIQINYSPALPIPKLPILRARDLIKIANKQNFRYEHTQGSHFIFRRPADGKVISIPVHKGHTLGRGITKSLIKQIGLTDDEFLRLLKK